MLMTCQFLRDILIGGSAMSPTISPMQGAYYVFLMLTTLNSYACLSLSCSTLTMQRLHYDQLDSFMIAATELLGSANLLHDL